MELQTGEENIRYCLVKLLEKKYHDFIYKKIFSILDTEEYTSNSNGIFIKLNDIEETKIQECIDFIKSINTSSINYIESEQDREMNIKKVQESMRQTSQNRKPVETPPKKSRVSRKKKKILKVPAVYKRIEQCMGRRNHVKKLEVYKGDSGDDHDTDATEETIVTVDQINEEEVADEIDEEANDDTEEINFKELGLDLSSDEESTVSDL